MRKFTSLFLLALLVSTVSCVKRERLYRAFPATDSSHPYSPQSSRININTASADELETLPGIGPGLAGRIIEHREKYGPFRRAEHLMIIRGLSEKRFEKLREFVTVQ